MKHRILALLLCLLLALPLAVGAQEIAAEDFLTGILEFKAAQSGAEDVSDWLAAGLPSAMGAGEEWYALALAQKGGYDLSACRAALLDYLADATVRSATTRQKYALTLLATGGTADFVTATLADSIGKQGLMSWAWGLHLLNNGCVSPEFTADDCIKMLLELRKADGGWAVTGNYGDADATAMVLQSLAPHRDKAEVASAIEAALAFLSAVQTEKGGYASYGVENAESAARVIIALCALNIDPSADTRFIKDSTSPLDALLAYRLADGSFAHVIGGAYSESATVQAVLALTAYQRFLAGEGSLYLLDGDQEAGEMKPELGCKPIAAAAIGGIALIVCVAFLLLGKRHPKNFLAVAILAAALIGLVYVTDFQSADDYYASTAVQKDDAVGSVILNIRCDKVAGRADHIPADGVILAETAMPIASGDTVYTILTDAARAHGIHMEASGANGLMYVNGIGNIYEFDFGDLSGWVYMVNGASASVGCDQYTLKDGDRVEWHYTLELGKDVY